MSGASKPGFKGKGKPIPSEMPGGRTCHGREVLPSPTFLYDSLDAFLDVLKATPRAPTCRSENVTPERRIAEIDAAAGPKRLAAIVKSADRWNAFGMESLAPRWNAAPSGSWCSVPAAVAGDPHAMRRRRVDPGVGPIRICAWNAVNAAAVDAHFGDGLLAIAGLACAVAAVRPTRLLVFDGCGFASGYSGGDRPAAWWYGWEAPISGTLNPREVARSLSPYAFMALLDVEERRHAPQAYAARWPHNMIPSEATWPALEEQVRLAFGLSEEDVVIPPTFAYGAHHNTAQQRALALWQQCTGTVPQ